MPKNEIKKYRAIILSSLEVGEYNRVYTALAKEKGKFSFLGVGVRKPQAKLASALEPITKSEIFLIEGRRIPRVVGALLEDQFLEIKKSLEKILLAQKALLMVKKNLPEEESCDLVFNGLEFYLEIVNKISKDDFLMENLARGGLIWKILEWSGRIPEIHRCFSCQKKVSSPQGKKIFFSVPEGLVCSQCQKDLQSQLRIFKVALETIKLMRFLGKIEQLIGKIRVEKSVARETTALLELVIKDGP